MGSIQFLLIVAAGIVLFRFFPVFVVWQKILTRKFRFDPPAASGTDEPPLPLAEVYRSAAAALRRQGFEYAHALLRTASYVETVAFVQVYYHAGSYTFALVTPRILASYPHPFQVEYLTYLADGAVVSTADGWGTRFLQLPGRHFFFDGFCGDPDAQLQLHRTSVEEIARSRGAGVLPLTPAQLADAEERSRTEALAFQEGKTLHRETDGTYTLRPGFAWRLAVSSVRELRTAKKKFASLPSPDLEAQIQADVHLLDEPPAHQGSSSRIRARRLLLAAGTAAMFAATFGLLYRWETVPLLLLVLVLHELGHLAAMKLFGYRDASMFFIPLVGAVILTGSERDISPLKKLLVYLMGPLPGLLIGVVLTSFTLVAGDRTWFEAGVMFIAVNYFNLLPIVPLDGGRIVELLIRRRFPWAPILFTAVSAVVLLLGALLLRAPVLVWAGILMIMTLPATLRLSRSVRLLAPVLEGTKEGPNLNRAVVEFIHRRLAGAGKSEGRLMLARRLRAHFGSAAPTRGEAAKGTALYVLSLASPIILFILLAASRTAISTILPGRSPFEWRNEIATAKTPDERREALLHGGQWLELTDRDSSAMYYRLALALSDSIPLRDAGYVTILERLAKVEEDSAQACRYLAQSLRWAERLYGPNHHRVAEILERSTSWDRGLLAESTRIGYLQRALAIRKALNDPASDLTRLRLASLYAGRNQPEEAEPLLRASMERADSSFKSLFSALHAVHMLAELYHTTARDSLAIDVLQSWERRMKNCSEGTWAASSAGLPVLELASHRGWIALSAGDTALARMVFTENLGIARSTGEKIDSFYPVIDYVLDLCYLDLRQGRVDESRRNFDWIKEKTGAWYFKQLIHPEDGPRSREYSVPWDDWKAEPVRARGIVVATFLPDDHPAETD